MPHCSVPAVALSVVGALVAVDPFLVLPKRAATLGTVAAMSNEPVQLSLVGPGWRAVGIRWRVRGAKWPLVRLDALSGRTRIGPDFR